MSMNPSSLTSLYIAARTASRVKEDPSLVSSGSVADAEGAFFFSRLWLSLRGRRRRRRGGGGDGHGRRFRIRGISWSLRENA
jgi:hypothetical protein